MKKLLYITVLTTVLWSCGGGGGVNPPPPTPTNHAPTTPTLTYPTNNLLCINNQLDFQYSSTDSDGDAITYQIQIATDNTFTTNLQTQTATTTSTTITLDKGVAYYWRVKATDSKSASSSYSSVYNFYTEGNGITNHLPFAPELVAPALNGLVQTATATLEWNGSDADTSDNLTYDVYFDTVNPPTTVVSTDQTSSTFTTATLSATTNYYWKIVVKDNQGGQTIGQIWNFKTD
jgi:hypothetical protein